MLKRAISAMCLLLVLTALHAQNWPSFRGPGATGIADGQNPPVSWDPDQSTNILWKTPIPGLSHASPVVWGDRIFLASVISSDPNPDFRRAFGLVGSEAALSSKDMSKQSWRLYSLDKNSGKILWEKVVREGVPRIKRHPKNTHGSQTPATDGKHVLVFLGSEGLYCYDVDGKLLWSQDLGVMEDAMGWGLASSPIIYKNLAIVQCDAKQNSFIAAFDIQTGAKAWNTPRKSGPSWSTPTIFEGKGRVELISNATDNIFSYDPITGNELWSLKGTSRQSIPTPFASGDLLFFFSGFHSVGPMFVIRPGASGDITPAKDRNSNPYVAWKLDRGAPEIPTPLVYGDYLYVVSNNGILTCYKAKTGERVYQERIGGEGGAFSASPVASEGRIYLTGEDGEVYVIKSGPTYELLAVNSMGEVCMATPAISRNMIILRTQHHLYGIGTK